LAAKRKGHGARSTELRAEHLEKTVITEVLGKGNVVPVTFLEDLHALIILKRSK
jgi:hypothetical protein